REYVTTRLEAPVQEPFSVQDGALQARGLTRRFGEVVALEKLDLDVAPGEVVAVVGPSGCGKSTLLELFAGLQEPDAGTVLAARESEPERRLAACALMFQRDLLMPW